VSTNRRISSFSLHQNLETLAHASGKDQWFDLYEALHGRGVAGVGKLLDLVEDAQTDQVGHLSCEPQCFERSRAPFINQVGEIDVCRNILFADPDIGILDRLMMPEAHQSPARLREELIAQIAIIDRQMIAAPGACSEVPDLMTCF